MIDSHCHLICPDFASDVNAVIARALGAGVTTLVTIADAVADIDPGISLAEKYEQIYCTAGVHPHHAKDFVFDRDLAHIRRAVSHPKCKAIGEIGLDYHYMMSPKDTQQRVFEAQLQLAKELKLPAVVHCREAVEDVWTIVNHVKPQKLVIHCCTEKWEDVKRFVDAGYLLSFTGIVTYPKSDIVRETVRQCPLDQMMVETDAPFLAPVPHRGKRCEPAFVMETAKKIAEVKEVSLEEVEEVTSRTCKSFYAIST